MIGYGFTGGQRCGRLVAEPLANEISIRARAQSIPSRGGRAAELPTYADALRILAHASKSHRVTTPGHRESAANPPGASGAEQIPDTHFVDSRASFPLDPSALPDMNPEDAERWEREMCGSVVDPSESTAPGCSGDPAAFNAVKNSARKST